MLHDLNFGTQSFNFGTQAIWYSYKAGLIQAVWIFVSIGCYIYWLVLLMILIKL
jgi:hypothetical protein